MANTPMMKQYLEIKEKNKDCIVFFRLGDFYEMFSDDAQTASRELDLTLTTRDRSKEKADADKVPMCGVPYHSAESYIGRLVAKGYKVAICEQTEDPALAKGLVKRDIVRVITPGTVTESSMLEGTCNNYFGCAYGVDDSYAVAFCDISTGEFYATACPDMDAVRNEMGRFLPREALLGGLPLDDYPLRQLLTDELACVLDQGEQAMFDLDHCEEILVDQFGPIENLGVSGQPTVIIAAGALVARLRERQKAAIPHVRRFEYYLTATYLEMDLSARRNLELTQTIRSKEKRGSLLWVLDKTRTPMGSRMLRSWMEKPLIDTVPIERRLRAVAELVENTIPREEAICNLRNLPDFERIMARVVTGSATGNDLLSFAQGASYLPDLKLALQKMQTPELRETELEIDPMDDMRTLIESAICDSPPNHLRDGGVIRDGYNEELDRLRKVMHGGRGMLADIEARERARTGIKNLRVSYNRVFGYYIEISKGQLNMVPDDYTRKQTLTTGERFVTDELKELENTIVNAKERSVQLENELYNELCKKLSRDAVRVQNTCHQIARADVLCCFATVAVANNYCRPKVDASGQIDIEQGRHPVVEQMLQHNMFVPNDTHLSLTGDRTAIITGPNMAGKSTYMRQVALIVLMAQMGCFVPAKSARVGIVDQIFTRIGASDDLAAGQSTFMVEMSEMASILKHATSRSLLILDEIGRGTSTYDGMAIARAVLEHVNNRKKLGAKTLFATHYHELAAAAEGMDGVRNFNVAVKKRGGEITFLRRIVEGAADNSFGVDVAKMAGLPESIIKRGREILRELEAGNLELPPKQPAAPQSAQVSMLDLQNDEVCKRLAALSVDTLTPIEALNELYQLKQLLAHE